MNRDFNLFSQKEEQKYKNRISSTHEKAVTQVSHAVLNVKHPSAFKGIRQFNVSFENIMKQLWISQWCQFFSAWTLQQVHESQRYFMYRRGEKGWQTAAQSKRVGTGHCSPVLTETQLLHPDCLTSQNHVLETKHRIKLTPAVSGVASRLFRCPKR